mgnify:CR=1 FL=1
MQMRRPRLMMTAVALGLVVGSCGPSRENETSHRHLAAEFCARIIDLQDICQERPGQEEIRQLRRDECESDPAWDWTDECGDKFFDYISCIDEMTCDEYLLVWDRPPEGHACQDVETAFYGGDCRIFDEDGSVIDHGGP